MKAFTASVIAVTLAALPMMTLGTNDDKVLQNLKGSVSDQHSSGSATPVSANASIAVADSDFTLTGATSLAAITLPDSSRVLVGSNSKVQLGFFNRTDIANAKFVVVNGLVRFKVEHPSGARANYTFQTPTGQIAVRGTEGDISVTPDELRVNIYQLSNPQLPVIVTLNDGRVFTLNQGQGIVIHAGVASQASSLTATLVDPFAEFGPADGADKFAVADARGSGAGSTATIAGAALGAAAAAAALSSGSRSGGSPLLSGLPTPTPTSQPTAQPTAQPTQQPTVAPTTPPTSTPAPGSTATPGPLPIIISKASPPPIRPDAMPEMNAPQMNLPRNARPPAL